MAHNATQGWTANRNLVWNVPTLTWIKMTQPGAGGGGLTDAELRASPVAVSGPLTDAQLRASAVPVSAASLPLPTGAATAALQTQPDVDIGDVTVNNASGAAAVNIQDGGNSITIDGTVSVSGSVDTELPAAAALADTTANPTTPLVGVANEMFNGTTWDRMRGDITNGLDVDVTRLPALVAGTANIGDVDVLTVPAPLSTTGGGTEATALRVTLANDSTGLISIDDNGGSLTVDGTVTANPATSAGKTLTYVNINQGAAGTTVLASASPGNRHKIIGAALSMNLAGTAAFTDGGGNLIGPLDIALMGGFVLPTSVFPYQQTGVNSALNLVTTVGAGRGVAIILTEA